VNGNIEKIHVREGQHVKKGELLVEIDTEAAKLELASKHYLRQKTKTEMLKMKGERRIADYKIKESELISLDYEIQLLKKKINSSKVYSKHEGVIISENLEDLYGMPVNFGQELLKVANKDKLIVQFQVPEEDVNFVANGQEIKFKVYGHPTKSFGTNAKIDSVAAEGRQVLESDPARYYFAKSLINVMGGSSEQGILKPGMTGRGKIYAQNESLGVVVFRKLYNFVIMEFLF
jgi:multidrug resistance efflux pump